VHQDVLDADVLEAQARQFGDEAVVPGVQPGGDQVDELAPALFLGAGLEQLLLPGRTVRLASWRCTISSPSWISASSVLEQ
jgi:hypothetical protein